jgi:hypothetical protein
VKKILILLAILLSACAPVGGIQPGSTPTAYIAPSYPTVASAPQTTIQQSNGIQVSADKAWRDGKQVNANICFTLIDASDWSISSATLQYPGGSMTDFSSTMLSIQEPANGQSGQRCDTLSFLNIPPDADLTNVMLTVDAIAAQPRPEDYCAIYMPKIQQALNDRGVAITLGCADANGVQTMQIVSKPDSMLQEEAEQTVYSYAEELYTIKGPWPFTFNLGQ